ncbi:MAG: UDP-N-acetylmuramoyl-L-alanyl-D-glutamate--2,6-diaminopimelate ligase [Oscillospiraceae bacterium]|nr:UDP-N-acetylmuramoyl-L-alanyl-D-glutamate--2,6-diaminopimelate ligase [Oscillospiraceae bacterium]
MKLKELLAGVQVYALTAGPDTEIRGVAYDSRAVEPGWLFAAVPGTKEDGATHLREAFARGAVCALCRSLPGEGWPAAVVPSVHQALAQVSANWFRHPADALTLLAVTGTNGKTTSTYLIRHILEKTRPARVGVVGTIRTVVGDRELPAQRTTPESYDLQALLRTMADEGCTHAVMEASSHALAQDRTWGLSFAAGLFTNLTRDHLDYHLTMERYCDDKALLFASCAAAAYNRDDPWHERVLRRFRGGSAVSYGLADGAQLRALDVCQTARGVTFTAAVDGESVPVRLRLPGLFSVYNALGAMAVCLTQDVSAAESAAALADFPGVKGRMEVLDTPGRDYTVLIDYAHTPDALENVLKTVRGFAEGRTVAVFGCGGDRDRTKRPQMGAIAARYADFSVVTSDNPRSERPEDIIAEVTAGMAGGTYRVVPDRTEAIRYALRNARPGDVIALCGKGHEDYQEVGGVKRHLDEREIVADFLAQE